MKKLLFFFVGLLCALPAISQVSIGSANTDVSLPVNPYYGFTFSQSIYLANEINTSGDIDSISYYLKPGSSLSNSNNWVVFIGHTTLSQFASTFIDVINSDKVFECTISITNDTIPNMYSCDSVVQTNLSVLYVDLSVDQSQNVYLSSNESDPAASYQWVNCSDSSPISGETSIDFTASALGDYACQISIGSSVQISECISVTSLDSSTSIGQYTKSDIKVYPNPNNGQFTLELSEKPQDKLHLSISNTLGQLIYSKELNSSNNAISLDGVDKGIYIMSLTSPTQSLKTRIVID